MRTEYICSLYKHSWNTETILPSEITEKTHFYWGEADNLRCTCRRARRVKERQDRQDCLPSAPFRDRWRESEGTVDRDQGQNDAKKGSKGLSCKGRLKPGKCGKTAALEFLQHSLMSPLCPSINHCVMEKGQIKGEYTVYTVHYLGIFQRQCPLWTWFQVQ